MKITDATSFANPPGRLGWQLLLTPLLLSLFLFSCSPKQEAKTETPQTGTEKKVVEPVVILEQIERDTLKGSLKAIATGRIGSTFVTIHYHSPAVRGRVVWGGLVPYDQVWVTGAHMATAIELEGPVKIGEQELSAGKYALFTIPSQNDWTIVINKNWDQHLTDEYQQKDDIVRLTVQPEVLTENQERLMYKVDNTAIVIQWEKIKLSLPVTSN